MLLVNHVDLAAIHLPSVNRKSAAAAFLGLQSNCDALLGILPSPEQGHPADASTAMDHGNLYDHAEECRQKALRYVGKPEAPFLLRIASEFDRLAVQRRTGGSENGASA